MHIYTSTTQLERARRHTVISYQLYESVICICIHQRLTVFKYVYILSLAPLFFPSPRPASSEALSPYRARSGRGVITLNIARQSLAKDLVDAER